MSAVLEGLHSSSERGSSLDFVLAHLVDITGDEPSGFFEQVVVLLREVLVVVVETDEGEWTHVLEAVKDDMVKGLGGVNLLEVGFFVEELVDLVSLGYEFLVLLFLVVSFLLGLVVVVNILHHIILGSIEEEDSLRFSEVGEEYLGLIKISEERVDDYAFVGNRVAVLDELIGFFLLSLAFILACELLKINIEVASFFVEGLSSGGFSDSWGSPEEDKVGLNSLLNLLVDLINTLRGINMLDFSEFLIIFNNWFSFFMESLDSLLDSFWVIISSSRGFRSFQKSRNKDILINM